jgi:hypothetical protein
MAVRINNNLYFTALGVNDQDRYIPRLIARHLHICPTQLALAVFERKELKGTLDRMGV